MKKIYLLLTCVIFLASSHVFSASRANSATFTLGGGYEFFSSKRQVRNTGIPLGMIGYNFTDHWGIEGLLSFFTTKSRRTDNHAKQVNGALFAIDGLYHFSPYRRFEPYVLAGVGVTGLNPSGNDAHNEGNVNAGAGLAWFATKAVALRVEARDLYTIIGGKNDVLIDAGVMFLMDLC
jgi:OOP family OmpA-OmpF porin